MGYIRKQPATSTQGAIKLVPTIYTQTEIFRNYSASVPASYQTEVKICDTLML
jgi:hypothetical protein